jgi:hypothetical protein
MMNLFIPCHFHDETIPRKTAISVRREIAAHPGKDLKATEYP